MAQAFIGTHMSYPPELVSALRRTLETLDRLEEVGDEHTSELRRAILLKLAKLGEPHSAQSSASPAGQPDSPKKLTNVVVINEDRKRRPRRSTPQSKSA